MTLFDSLLPARLSYPAALALTLVLVGCVLLLALGQKRLPPAIRAALLLVIVLCAAYFALLLWLTLGFGRGPQGDPVPIQPL